MDNLAEYGRQILSLIVVFTLLGLTVWKLGRRRVSLSPTLFGKSFGRGVGSGERALKKVERLVLTPQHTLHVLRFRDREMLVVTHPQGCTVLDSEPNLLSRGAEA